ncbi:flagellar hook-associated protein FlgL [Methylohalobius crimeensis]|uniref:flagellar hook-associated protein FlgL n=1 Tax=Methylohalobius crimeensis TaxID=244365 RepID=UPI0003B39916|nr:flagellar hook-associated protein FlgL [Methylohalobius crimeensis]
MRLSTSLMQQLGVNAILDQQSKLNKTQLQLATGKTHLTPADDPIAAARGLNLQEEIRKHEQYQDNIDAATNRLSLEESTLSSLGNMLHRVRELAVQANNQATLKPEDEQAIAHEARQLLDEMVGLANTKNANGEYLFAGTRSHTQPYSDTPDPAPDFFVYQGDANQRQIQIGPTRRIADGDSGAAVFENIPVEGGFADTNLFNIVHHFALALEDNPPDNDNDPSTGIPAAEDIINDTLSNLDNALERINTVRAGVGARLNAVDEQQRVNEHFVVEMQGNLSEIQDLDYAGAISRFNLQQTALQAAQQAFVRVQGLSLFNFLG